MTEYEVSMPITGFIVIRVEADCEEEAIQKAYESDVTTDDIEEWDMTEHVTKGNVTYALLNDVEIYEV